MLEAILYFDGSCWPNPGPNSRCGYVLQIGDKKVEKKVELGTGTNNTAEYQGLIHGLEKALEYGVMGLIVRGDSRLVINAVTKGRKHKKHPHLEKLRRRAVELLEKFEYVEVLWVPRAENSEADAVCGGDFDIHKPFKGWRRPRRVRR